MAAQEFSSPGAHMSGADKGISNGRDNNVGSSVIYAPSGQANAPVGVLYQPSSGGSSGVINDFVNHIGTGYVNTPAQGNSLLGQNSFSSFDDVFRGITTMLQNTYGGSAQALNNQQYKDMLEYQNEFNTNSANKAMKFSREMAERQMAFQQYNADTSYQRAAKDLKSAGLNPVLAAFNGGADVPSGSSPQGTSAQSAGANYDEGYNGISSVIGQLINSLPMLSIASALNGMSGLKNLVNGISNTANDIVTAFNDIVTDIVTDVSDGLSGTIDTSKFNYWSGTAYKPGFSPKSMQK